MIAPSLAMRSMLGVRKPIMPLFHTDRFHSPISSPKITRILGFLPDAAGAGVCACASSTARPSPTAPSTASDVPASTRRRPAFISFDPSLITHSFSARFESFEFLQALQRSLLRQHSVVDARDIEGVARLERELVEVSEELLDLAADRHNQPHLLADELHVLAALLLAALVRVHAQVADVGPSWHLARCGRDVALGVDCKGELPVVPSNGVQVAALIEVVDRVARPLLRLALEVRQEIIAIEM